MRTPTTTGLNYNKTIYDAIQKISRHGVINPRTNTTYSGGNISGFVAKIHNDPSDELFGTIDVKEWNALTGDEKDITKEGYHEGVYLSAIQDSSNGSVIIPKLYSDVIISQDPQRRIEFVVMYSHVDVIRLDAYEEVVVGVTEREEFKEDENSPDIDELQPTGIKAVTTYKKDAISSEVVDEKGAKVVRCIIDLDSLSYNIADGQVEHKATKDSVSTIVNKGEILLKVGGELIKLTSDGVFLGSDNNTSHAVLGEQLGKILCNILDMIGQIKTATQLGPQPPINVAQFISTKAQVNAWTSSVSNFLTQKVNVQR